MLFYPYTEKIIYYKFETGGESSTLISSITQIGAMHVKHNLAVDSLTVSLKRLLAGAGFFWQQLPALKPRYFKAMSL